MILHYLKIVFRQMAKRKAQTAISILGITAGLLCFSVCNYYNRIFSTGNKDLATYENQAEICIKERSYQVNIPIEDFEKKIIDNDVKAFILCSPHNPVARVWTKEELTRMFEICHRHHVYVISDEIHQDFVFGDKVQIPSYQATEHWDEMVAITAPSKTFNLAGGQNSFMIIADEKLRARWDDFAKRIRLMTGNAFGFVAAEAAYKGGQDWLDKVKKQIVDNDQYLRELFKENLPEIVVTPLEGTYLVWIDLRAYVKPEDTREFIQKKCRLAVDFGDWFGTV